MNLLPSLSFFLILLFLPHLTFAVDSTDYFEMVEDILDENPSYYQILLVPQDATLEQIKKSFRRLSLIHHPDKSKDPAAGQIYIKMRFAYKILSDEKSRLEYDDLLINGRPSSFFALF